MWCGVLRYFKLEHRPTTGGRLSVDLHVVFQRPTAPVSPNDLERPLEFVNALLCHR
jgi:hypothetical protein